MGRGCEPVFVAAVDGVIEGEGRGGKKDVVVSVFSLVRVWVQRIECS